MVCGLAWLEHQNLSRGHNKSLAGPKEKEWGWLASSSSTLCFIQKTEQKDQDFFFFLSFCQRKIKRGVKCFGRQYVAVVTSSMERRHSVVQSKRKVLVSEQATTFPLKSFSVSSLVQTF